MESRAAANVYSPKGHEGDSQASGAGGVIWGLQSIAASSAAVEEKFGSGCERKAPVAARRETKGVEGSVVERRTPNDVTSEVRLQFTVQE